MLWTLTLQQLKNSSKKLNAEGLKNIIAKVGKAEDTVFCKECADFIFFSMDLHDFYDPVKSASKRETNDKTKWATN